MSIEDDLVAVGLMDQLYWLRGTPIARRRATSNSFVVSAWDLSFLNRVPSQQSFLYYCFCLWFAEFESGEVSLRMCGVANTEK